MLAIVNATLHIVSRPVLKKGSLLIKNGKIAAVGPSIKIPKSAQVMDGSGSHLIPGLIDAHCHLGIGGEGMGGKFGDGNELRDPVCPHLRARDAIWHDDPAFEEVLAAGVTTVWVCPGSVNMFGGVGVALKTVPGLVDERILPGTEGMKMALGENPKRVHHNLDRAPNTRMGVAAYMRETLFKAVEYGRLRKKGTVKERDFRMEALQPLLAGKMKARIHAHRADDIATALRIGKEFDLDVVIEHCTEGFLVKDLLLEHGVSVVAGPHLSGRGKPETSRRNLANVAELHRVGIPLALQTDAGSAAQFLMANAAVAVREGLPREAALRSVTLTAAEILGVDHRIGSLDKGKDADVVLLPGDPFDITQKPTTVLVNGKPTV